MSSNPPKAPTATATELADILSLTQARLSQLVADGVIVKISRNTYDLLECVKAYIAYLRNRKINQHGASGNADLDAERLRKTTEEADKLAIANARSRGELIEVVKVEKLMQACFTVHRTRILNFPLTDEEKHACLSDLMALTKIDWAREAGL